ncbi:hypothetical protein F5884DRAFT_893907 [Xylogone sp. PMI_703]|nr:hypothetical protein F5884DRAFT_893907 [Xylogone sp. PMI_703]
MPMGGPTAKLASSVAPHFTGRHAEVEGVGPFKFLNPTTRRFPLPPPSKTLTERTPSQERQNGETTESETEKRALNKKKKNEIGASEVQLKWRTRDNRKGRHTLEVKPAKGAEAKYRTPPLTNTFKSTIKGILRMFTNYPWYDVSYLVAIFFTLGSMVWIINCFFVWLPLEDPNTEFSNEITTGGGVTAFIGATIFFFGSILLMIEAVNENRTDCFGWAVEEALEERGLVLVKADSHSCLHHHKNRHNLVGKARAIAAKPLVKADSVAKEEQHTSKDARSWTWWPTWYELRTHYFKEIGFLASSFQMVGATIFWIAGFSGLPPIYNRLTSTAAQNCVYWLPQVIGGTGFIISGAMFTLETQKKWWLPAPGVLGWHIGAWNFVGGIGFTLCGALGFASANSGAQYQSSLATFWGSWCFLIGSVIQWYESLDKHPVEKKAGDDTEKMDDSN